MSNLHDYCSYRAVLKSHQLNFQIMQELIALETSILVDLLAQQTSQYTKMLSEGSSEEEFARCNLTIRAIQSEIESRKRTSANTSISDPNILLPE